jgi:4-amino-4-deoxy-L-arabinose transferase-like glycosyltransferase
MTVPSFLRRVPPAVWVLLAGAALLLPGLGSFGLWEPSESELVGRLTSEGPRMTPYLERALPLWGLGLVGGEGGLRLGFALTALAAVLVVYWAGRGLGGRRAALLAAGALLGMPLFLFQGRQLTSDMPLVLALALAAGGWGRLLWGARPSRLDLGAGLLGLVVGQLSGGTLVGVVAPLAAVAGATLVQPPADRRKLLLARGLGVAAVLGLALFLRPQIAGVYSQLLGGVPRLGAAPQTFEALIRQAGFGLFPWSALAFFALGRALIDADEQSPRAGAGLYFLLLATFVLAASTVRARLVGDGRFTALAPVALALGSFLDDGLGSPEDAAGDRLLALLAAVGTVLVARDLYLEPEELFSVHTLAKIKWPPQVSAGGLLLGVGLLFSGALAVGLATRRRAALLGTVAIGLALAVALVQVLVPQLSRHLSRKAVVDVYRHSAANGEPLARYRVEGPGAAAWHAAPGPVLATREALAGYLRRPERSFALVGAEELASVDEAIKAGGGSYGVLDASSRLLLLTNRLLPGEEDRNPLRRNVWTPAVEGARPPWPAPRVKTTSVFGGAVELLGADFPSTVRRPGGLPVTLTFRVRQRPPAGYGIFMHLEDASGITNGDHQPVEGTFPTAFWLPGEFIRDEHTIDLPLALTSAGSYRLLVGMWPGGNRARLPVTSGETDGNDRVPLGMVTVR